MKIAVTYENGQVFQHFGHTEAFKVYEIEDGAVRTSRIIGTDGFGHGALAGFLREQGICVLICGGIGGGAINALQQAGIEVYAGVSGDADQAVAALLAGSLTYSSQANCSHHGHGEHSCHGHEGHGEGGCHVGHFLHYGGNSRSLGGKGFYQFLMCHKQLLFQNTPGS